MSPTEQNITCEDLVEALTRIEQWVGSVRDVLANSCGRIPPLPVIEIDGPRLDRGGVCPPPRGDGSSECDDRD